MLKTEIRNIKIKERNQITKEEALIKSNKICESLKNSELYKKSQNIMLYYPYKNEVDTLLLFIKIKSDGKNLILPLTNNNKIMPVRVNNINSFKIGEHGIKVPTDYYIFSKNKIDLVVVPGIAFSKSGDRIGFGSGCYDRFLQDTNVTKVGVCYDFQLADFKSEEHDIKMDYIITDKEVIKVE